MWCFFFLGYCSTNVCAMSYRMHNMWIDNGLQLLHRWFFPQCANHNVRILWLFMFALFVGTHCSNSILYQMCFWVCPGCSWYLQRMSTTLCWRLIGLWMLPEIRQCMGWVYWRMPSITRFQLFYTFSVFIHRHCDHHFAELHEGPIEQPHHHRNDGLSSFVCVQRLTSSRSACFGERRSGVRGVGLRSEFAKDDFQSANCEGYREHNRTVNTIQPHFVDG